MTDSRHVVSRRLLFGFLLGSFSPLLMAAEPSFDIEPSFGSEPGFGGPAVPASAPRTEKVLPPLELSDLIESPVAEGRLRVNSVVLRGNTILTEADVAAVVQPYLQRDLTPEDLQALRQALTLLYVNQGYVNSGVVLPNQTVEANELVFVAIEGQLTEVLLEQGDGSNALDEDYVRREVGKEVAEPLNLADLQTAIRRLELDPLVRRVEGRLVPGAKPGEASLGLKIQENHPFRIVATLDNHEPPSVGAERGSVVLEHLNVTGNRDSLWTSLSATEGLKEVYVGYRRPLQKDRMDFGIYYERGTADVIEQPFDRLDIESDKESFGVSLDYHLIDRLDRRLTILSGLDYAKSETDLLGRPFSFSLGARDGESTSTSLRLGVEWTERWDNQLLALRSSVRQGIDWLGSTTIPGGQPTEQLDTGAEIPDSKFTLFLTQAQWANRLNLLNSELVVNATWQQALDPLLAVDKLAIGGNDSVRGFRENAFVRDSGVYTNVEWWIPVLRDNNKWSRWNMTVVPFFDYGRSWDYDDNLSTSDAVELASVGLGVTASPMRGVYLELFYGQRISDDDYLPGDSWDLQDEGIHFSVSYQWSPDL